MAAKLKSTLSQIPWFLALKAGALAAIWFAAPWWLFCACVLFLYFIPLFRPLSMLVPLAVALAIGATLPPTALTAGALGALFFCMFGIKDLLLIDRHEGYRILLFIFLFTIGYAFFRAVNSSADQGALFVALVCAALVFMLLLSGTYPHQSGTAPTGSIVRRLQIFIWLITVLLLWQWMIVLLLLPLLPLARMILFFFFATMLLDTSIDYVGKRLRPQTIMVHGGIFVFITLLILSTNQWGL